MSVRSAVRRRMGLGVLFALALAVAGWHGAQAQKTTCPLGANALGVSRTVEIDTTTGPRFGGREKEFLADHEVVLTFDDGPHRSFTRQILAALDAHCTKATFFMVGQRALGSGDIIRDVAARGHTVATHTWSHRNQSHLSAAEQRNEIELGISAVQRSLGAPAAPFFRFPYLAEPASARAYLKSRHTAIFNIDVDSHDYLTRSPTKVIRNVMRGLEHKRKGIILFHDIQASTTAALPALLAELKKRGYKIVHVRAKAPQMTLAQYDHRLPHAGATRLPEPRSIPVAQRAVTAPAWEFRIAPAAAPGTRPAAEPARLRSSRAAPHDDWRNAVFRGY